VHVREDSKLQPKADAAAQQQVPLESSPSFSPKRKNYPQQRRALYLPSAKHYRKVGTEIVMHCITLQSPKPQHGKITKPELSQKP